MFASARPARAALGSAPMATPQGATVRTLSASQARNAVHAAVQTAQQINNEASAAASASSSSSSTSSQSAYTVRETTLAGGTVVREYVSSTGTVFGIAWTGPQAPDLNALLGSYFPQYVEGVKARRAAGAVRGPGIVEGPGLVVHSGGHMGAFSGQAWLPQALPAGVSGDDIE